MTSDDYIIYIYIHATGSRQIKMAAERKEDFNQERFISATMVSGLRRSFILQVCIFRLHCNFEENLPHFDEVSARFYPSAWLKLFVNLIPLL